MRTRETNNDIKSVENKEKKLESIKYLLIEDTFGFCEKLANNQNREYTYDVEFIVLKDLKGSNSFCNSDQYKEFYNDEISNLKNKRYDLNVNIRDLYPLSIHIDNKNEKDINRFNVLNDLILGLDDRISRRVVKKEIVYKKNKSKSIIAIRIFNDYLNVYMSDLVEDIDFKNKASVLAKSNRKPLDRVFIIKNDNDIEYVSDIIKGYKELLF